MENVKIIKKSQLIILKRGGILNVGEPNCNDSSKNVICRHV